MDSRLRAQLDAALQEIARLPARLQEIVILHEWDCGRGEATHFAGVLAARLQALLVIEPGPTTTEDTDPDATPEPHRLWVNLQRGQRPTVRLQHLSRPARPSRPRKDQP